MAKGRKLARQQFTEMVNTTHRNMTNKYGETVTPHSKVCSICHQRVDGLKGYVLDHNYEVICMHCEAKAN